MAAPWDEADDRAAIQLVSVVCDDAVSAHARDVAWKRLLVQVAPHVEHWARHNRLLMRSRLAGEDDARAVMVAVIERLSNGRFEALRRFLVRRAPVPDEGAERDVSVLERVARLAVEPDEIPSPEPSPQTASTPLRAWLLTITRYAAADHVRARLGWAEAGPGGGSKRGLGTDAERLDAVPDAATRPPMTDYLTLKRLLEEIHAFLATLPEPMQSAVALWIEDESFEAIASRLSLEGPEKARALARAGQARLREKFRATWPELVSSGRA